MLPKTGQDKLSNNSNFIETKVVLDVKEGAGVRLRTQFVNWSEEGTTENSSGEESMGNLEVAAMDRYL